MRYLALLVLVGCGPTLTLADESELAKHGGWLAKCHLEARAAHDRCVAVDAGACNPAAREAYAACKRDGGL